MIRIWEIGGSPSGAAVDRSLLGRYVMSDGKYLPAFQHIVVCSGLSSVQSFVMLLTTI
jgi:hypothetical protein